MRRCWSKSSRLQLCKMNNSRDRTHSMTIVNNTTLNTGNLLGADFRCSHYKQKINNYVGHMLFSLNVVIISLIYISNHHVLHIKYIYIIIIIFRLFKN